MSSQNEYRVRRNTQYPAADGVNSHYSYQPSTLLLCALIFATALCAACDFINGPLTVIFSVTTYAPTIHFATQGIVRNVFQSKLSDQDTVKASYRAIFLACIWCLSSGVHYLVWSSKTAKMTGDFLVTVVPGIQSALFVAFIAIRTTWDARIIKYMDTVELQGEENNPISETTVHTSPFTGEDNVLSSPESVPISYMVSVNRPSYGISRALLLSSVALTSWTAISDLIITEKDKEGKEIVHIFLVLSFIPTVLLHLYIMIRGPARTFNEAAMIGSVSLDLVPLWIGSQIVQARYIHFCDQAIWHAALVSSIFETMVVGYIALQYGSVVLAEWRSIRMVHAGETSIAPSDIDSEYNPQMSPTDIMPPQLPTFYQPSIVTLMAYTGAAITCSVVESSADFAYGTLMSLLVYIPTIFACAMSALRRQEGIDCGLGNRCTAADNEPERFVHVGLLWAFTQAFYVLLVPPMQGKGTDTEPYLRWATVALGLYVSARYIWDHYHQTATVNLTAEEPRQQNSSAAMYNEDLYTHRTEEGRHLSGPCMMRPWI